MKLRPSQKTMLLAALIRLRERVLTLSTASHINERVRDLCREDEEDVLDLIAAVEKIEAIDDPRVSFRLTPYGYVELTEDEIKKEASQGRIMNAMCNTIRRSQCIKEDLTKTSDSVRLHCTICKAPMIRMVEGDGRYWMKVDGFTMMELYCPNCLPETFAPHYQAFMKNRHPEVKP